MVSGYRSINQLRQAFGLMKELPGICDLMPVAVVPVHSTPTISDQAFSTPGAENSSKSNGQRLQAGKHTEELAWRGKSDLYMLHGVGSSSQTPDEIHQTPSHAELPSSDYTQHTCISTGDPLRQCKKMRVKYKPFAHSTRKSQRLNPTGMTN